MTDYKVDLAKLDWTITDMQAYMKALDTELSGIDAKMRTLQHGWTGQAADAQAAAHAQWSTGAKNMHHSVGVMQKAAQTTHGNYTGAAAKNMEIWGA